ncbi:HpcH/HpaI aldolase/citrate lyase family protein [Bordetella sp. BOR01]|uniref:HpcH/HpaI aldolase family protein n=1 Tax=Bordetella sp. BOR01 TaxID=2854779 RepID=UPI001C4766A4|nr:aldolase/citrate lyase family protein [Bordetella sp. BOR01]MBV7486052.1 aldolase [Bordetella sp. BOR01]
MLIRENRIKSAMAQGRVPLGAFVQMASPEIVEAAGHAGYDYVWIDGEHGSFGLDTTVQMIRAAEATGMTPMVRVPTADASLIMRALDAGAMGVIVPQVSTRAQAVAAVQAARYRHGDNVAGRRGACPLTRATGHQTLDWPAYAAWANLNVMVWLLVETVEGLANLDDILTVPGVDAVVLGAFDLAVSMGHDGDRNHPAVVERLDGMIQAVRDKDVDVVGLLFDADIQAMERSRRHYVESGCRILVAGSDRRLLANGFTAIVDQLGR